MLDRLGPFAATARPALRELGKAAVPANQALREGRAELDELRRLAADAPATAKPLRQLLQSLDDRRRAIDQDPRAKVNGPPATDPSYAGGRGGFTGFESIAQLLLLAGDEHQRVRRHRAPAARRRDHQQVQPVREQREPTSSCSRTATRGSGRASRASTRPDPGQPSPAATSVAERSEKPRASGAASGAARASPTPARCPASATSPSRRSACRPPLEDLLKRLPELSPPKVPNLPNDAADHRPTSSTSSWRHETTGRAHPSPRRPCWWAR